LRTKAARSPAVSRETPCYSRARQVIESQPASIDPTCMATVTAAVLARMVNIDVRICVLVGSTRQWTGPWPARQAVGAEAEQAAAKSASMGIACREFVEGRGRLARTIPASTRLAGVCQRHHWTLYTSVLVHSTAGHESDVLVNCHRCTLQAKKHDSQATVSSTDSTWRSSADMASLSSTSDVAATSCRTCENATRDGGRDEADYSGVHS
jgi:hypothetical protein